LTFANLFCTEDPSGDHYVLRRRELKSYGEFVKASDLIVGRVYFGVSFLDEDMAIPEVVPLVLIGRDLSPEQLGLYYQDAASFFEGKRWDDTNDEPADGLVNENQPLWRPSTSAWFETEADGTYSHVYEFDKALDSVPSCSLKRRKWDGRVQLPEQAEEVE
jgi:hypothetical protein